MQIHFRYNAIIAIISIFSIIKDLLNSITSSSTFLHTPVAFTTTWYHFQLCYKQNIWIVYGIDIGRTDYSLLSIRQNRRNHIIVLRHLASITEEDLMSSRKSFLTFRLHIGKPGICHLYVFKT